MKEIKMPCEIYSRVVGYYRPVGQWNLGKKEEYRQRKEIKIAGRDMSQEKFEQRSTINE